MRLATLAVVSLALLAALLVWWRAREEAGTRPLALGAPSADVAAHEAGTSGVSNEPATDLPRAAASNAPDERTSAETPPAQVSADGSALVRLHGVLRRSDDRAPASGAALVFVFDGEVALATTDADGRFATERVVRPGGVSVVHRADDARSEYEARLDVAPEELLIPEGDERGDVPPLELTLLVPDAWIAIEVRRPGGVPAAGAFVETALERIDDAARQPLALAIQRCGADGRARFAVRGGPDGARAALFARDGELVSEIVELAPPWPDALLVLALEAGGELRVRVADEAGQPVEGRRVDVALLGRTDFLATFDGATPASGMLAFRALPAGRYRAVTWVEEVRERVSAEIDVARGEPSELTLVVPRLALGLAAAGRVVDEDGRPLEQIELALEHESGKVLSARTDAEGRFEFQAEPCGVVTVALDRDPWGDEYDPPRRRVSFGARGLDFARRSAAQQESLLVEIVDGESGARIRGAAVMVFRAPHYGEYAMFRAEEGLAALRFKALETIRFGVDAVGYRRRELARDQLLPGGEGAEARAELERGFERTLQIRSASGEPVRGAEVRVVEALVATSDVDGSARVDLTEWPAELVISAAGFESARIAPADFLWDLGPALIELAPLAAESR